MNIGAPWPDPVEAERRVRVTQIGCTSDGMNTWRAGCSGSCTSGSEGGPGKPISRKAGRAPRSDPYTEHPTREGIVYLAVVIDAWNREIIGWSIANHLRAQIVCDAFEMARWKRRPRPHSGLVHHSDHGKQYTSWAFGKKLRQAGILKSMGTVGDAYDNAVVESFFATLQTELLDRRRWETRHQLGLSIFEYIEGWYNTERRHSHNNQQSPVNHRHQQLVA